ncbi:hypothetical protein [Herbaspirillum rubrisubalbicans]|uniref:hypothetical protein n=1 Tax=Herbaspirillum rubrisubalbicans TaxID=80842 RepID=UPI0015C54996|nr:hypothetical protein [Herbaspirillum rubrisubalbicans]
MTKVDNHIPQHISEKLRTRIQIREKDLISTLPKEIINLDENPSYSFSKVKGGWEADVDFFNKSGRVFRSSWKYTNSTEKWLPVTEA